MEFSIAVSQKQRKGGHHVPDSKVCPLVTHSNHGGNPWNSLLRIAVYLGVAGNACYPSTGEAKAGRITRSKVNEATQEAEGRESHLHSLINTS